jgi:hypothetical protein
MNTNTESLSVILKEIFKKIDIERVRTLTLSIDHKDIEIQHFDTDGKETTEYWENSDFSLTDSEMNQIIIDWGFKRGGQIEKDDEYHFFYHKSQ